MRVAVEGVAPVRAVRHRRNKRQHLAIAHSAASTSPFCHHGRPRSPLRRPPRPERRRSSRRRSPPSERLTLSTVVSAPYLSPRSPWPALAFVFAVRRRSTASERPVSSISLKRPCSSRRAYILLRPVSINSRRPLLRLAMCPSGRSNSKGRSVSIVPKLSRATRYANCWSSADGP